MGGMGILGGVGGVTTEGDEDISIGSTLDTEVSVVVEISSSGCFSSNNATGGVSIT